MSNKPTFSTLREVYEFSISKFTDKPSFSLVGGESLTYREFDERVRKIQTYLTVNLGLGHGDKVAIFSRSLPSWPAVYFACVTTGIIAVPILPDFNGEQVTKLIHHSGAQVLFVGSRLLKIVPKETIESLRAVVMTDDLSLAYPNEEISPAQTEPQPLCETKPTPEDLAVIIYTSGTTSEPKGVMLSHKALTYQIACYKVFFAISPEDVFLSILPLSHTYECSVGMIYPFSEGSSVVYLDRPPTAAVLMPAFKQVRPTILISVPLVVEKIYKSQVMGRINSIKVGKSAYKIGFVRKMWHRAAGKALMSAFGGQMRFLAIGGAKLSFEAERFLHEGRLPYAVGYGLTETAPLLFAAAPGQTKVGTTGKAVLGIQARLAEVNQETGEGELEVLTPSIMNGYYLNPEATAAAFSEDGWFKTNDIGTIDKYGYLSILGRANNMIVGPSGENVYPEEVEEIANSHELVSESIVLMEDGMLKAIIAYDRDRLAKALKSLTGDKECRMKEIRKEILAHINEKVGANSRIFSIIDRFEPFEKTPTQKIKRRLYDKASKR